jgi:hypothetical protein
MFISGDPEVPDGVVLVGVVVVVVGHEKKTVMTTIAMMRMPMVCLYISISKKKLNIYVFFI